MEEEEVADFCLTRVGSTFELLYPKQADQSEHVISTAKVTRHLGSVFLEVLEMEEGQVYLLGKSTVNNPIIKDKIIELNQLLVTEYAITLNAFSTSPVDIESIQNMDTSPD